MGGKTWKPGFDPWPEARMATAPSGSYHPATLPGRRCNAGRTQDRRAARVNACACAKTECKVVGSSLAAAEDVFWPFFSLESCDNDVPNLSWLMYLSMYNVADCN